MAEHVFALPDLGEGTVEAEIVEWHVAPGDEVREGDVIVDVMTDKANVEVPSPVSGTVLRITGAPGDKVAVGAELIAFTTSGAAPRAASAERPAPPSEPPATGAPEPVAAVEEPAAAPPERAASPATAAAPPPELVAASPATPGAPQTRDRRVLTSPSIRRQAAERGIDLHEVAGSGPEGRITQADFDAFVASAGTAPAAAAPPSPGPVAGLAAETSEEKPIGVRRIIAERTSQSYREIPHFTYVEEVDVTEVVALEHRLEEATGTELSLLHFVALAVVKSLASFPALNAHYDAERGVVRKFGPVHLGIATQTSDGLKVPVVRNAEALDLWQLAERIGSVAERARSGALTPAELTGSTITISSLGRLGGVAATPIINYPEVAILGVNKAVDRPVVADGRVVVRTMMNLSGSFDHRFIDGYEAASWVQALKRYLETAALLWVEPSPKPEP